MAWFFADGFDTYIQGYEVHLDSTYGYWDPESFSFFLISGYARWGGYSLDIKATYYNSTLVKKSSSDDSVHHINCVHRHSVKVFPHPSDTYYGGMYFQLSDGATPQCTIMFMSNGDITLIQGQFDNTVVLATWPKAMKRPETWESFEFEVVVHNTAGSFAGRKNGKTTNDFFLGGLDTAGGTAHNYANRLQLGYAPGSFNPLLDDFVWRSGTTVPWAGDIRCFQRRPDTNASIQFSKFPATVSKVADTDHSHTASLSPHVVRSMVCSVPISGMVTGLQFNFAAGITGRARMALYSVTTNQYGQYLPVTLLVETSELVNPGSGINTFPIPGGYSLRRNTPAENVYIAIWSDAAIVGNGNGGIYNYTFVNPATYGPAFPTSGGTSAGYLGEPGSGSQAMVIVPHNYSVVADMTDTGIDDQTTYTYDDVVGHADFYGLTPPIDPMMYYTLHDALLPTATVGVVTRGKMQKSGPGQKSAAMRLKIGATTVSTPTIATLTGGDQYNMAWRADTVDPTTGVAWTNAALDSAQIGPIVVA